MTDTQAKEIVDAGEVGEWLDARAVEEHGVEALAVPAACGYCADAGVVTIDGRETDCPECAGR